MYNISGLLDRYKPGIIHPRALNKSADGRIVGLVTTMVTKSMEFPTNGYTKVNGLAVLPEYQGRGIGRKLLETIERRASERSAGHIVLASGMHRTEAHEFYECAGYRKTSFWFRKNLE